MESAAPFAVSLTFSCGCSELIGHVAQLSEDAERQVDVPCVPETCSTCRRDGLCQMRREMLNYRPVDFHDIGVGGPKRYRRMAS